MKKLLYLLMLPFLLTACNQQPASPAAQQPAQAQQPPQNGQAPLPTMESLPAEVARLNALVPSNSHFMMDVQWHWTNLWFAGKAKNWPLAQYYFNESRGHIQWFVKKSPTLKSAGPEKEEVNIAGIFEGIDTSSLAAVKTAINKDSAQFAYKTMLESAIHTRVPDVRSPQTRQRRCSQSSMIQMHLPQ